MISIRRIQIDLNRRNAAGHTPAKYFGPTPRLGEQVVAYEPEDGVRASAVVVGVDDERCTVELDVDWESMSDDSASPAPALGTFGALGAFRLDESPRKTGTDGSGQDGSNLLVLV